MFIVHNGSFFPASQPVLTPDNRSFKWGDGLFETIRFHREKILLEELHFERLFTGLSLLQVDVPSDFNAVKLAGEIGELCKKNNCADSARVRLAIYRNEANGPGYTIEAITLSSATEKQDGLLIGVYPFARKSMDAFSNIKSASFLPYVLAARYAVEKGWDDALLLNTDAAVCDTSRTNIFIIKGDEFFTPPLNSGCVTGVMRRFVIESLHRQGRAVHQRSLTETDLQEAEEIFLTNAITGIRSVGRFEGKAYGSQKSSVLRQDILSTIYG